MLRATGHARMVMSDVVRPSFEANRGRVRAAYKRSLDTRNAYGLMIFCEI